MEFLGSIASFGATIASGGLLGIAGSVIGGALKWLNKREERKQRKEDQTHELNLIEKQMQVKAAETEAEAKLKAVEGSWKGLSQSMRHDTSVGDIPWQWLRSVVNTIRSLFRPALTIGLFFMVLKFWNDLSGGGAVLGINALLTDIERVELMKYIVYSVVFMATTAGTWWFGDRAFAPPGMKNR